MILDAAHLARIVMLSAALTPAIATAQTLPQSTVDRQTIAQLQYQLTQPGVSQQQRLAIQEQISELQYRINTRPLISKPPGAPTPPPLIPNSSAGAPFSAAPLAQGAFAVPHIYYGSCDADKSMIAYESAELKNSTLTQDERGYVSDRLRQLHADMRARRC